MPIPPPPGKVLAGAGVFSVPNDSQLTVLLFLQQVILIVEDTHTRLHTGTGTHIDLN